MVRAATATDRAARAEATLRLEEARLKTEQARLMRSVVKNRRRALASYDAAKRDRRDKGWRPTSKSADAAIIPDLPTLIARSRAMCRDNPHARSVVRSFGRNVIGKGITPAAAARFKTGRDRTAFNGDADALFFRWANDRKLCDVEGAKSFWQIQRMAIEHLVEVGEFLIILRSADNGPGMVPMRLQAVEAEQLDLEPSRNRDNGNTIRGGVEIDRDGRAVAYHIHDRTPEDLQPVPMRRDRSVRVPAERVLHLFVQDRPGQTRGVTWLASVLRKLRDAGEYDGLELWTARMQACIGIGIERPGGADGNAPIGLPPGAGEDELAPDGSREVNWEPGMFFESEPGEKVHFFTPNRPSGQYDPFMKAQIRAIAAGVGLSYEQVARDFSQGNFSSQRQALLEDRREWEPLQELVMHVICQPVWDRFLRLGVMSGVLTAPSFFQNAHDFCVCEWQPHAWEWIDPAKQAAAAKIMLDEFLTTRRRLLNSQGQSLRETFQQRADENSLADELDLVLPENKAGGPKVDPAEPRPRGASDEATDDADDDRREEGDNQDEQSDELAAVALLDALADAPPKIQEAVLCP